MNQFTIPVLVAAGLIIPVLCVVLSGQLVVRDIKHLENKILELTERLTVCTQTQTYILNELNTIKQNENRRTPRQ